MLKLGLKFRIFGQNGWANFEGSVWRTYGGFGCCGGCLGGGWVVRGLVGGLWGVVVLGVGVWLMFGGGVFWVGVRWGWRGAWRVLVVVDIRFLP